MRLFTICMVGFIECASAGDMPTPEAVPPFLFSCEWTVDSDTYQVDFAWNGNTYSIREPAGRGDYLIDGSRIVPHQDKASPDEAQGSYSFKGRKTFSQPKPDDLPPATLGNLTWKRDDDGTYSVRIFLADLTSTGFLTSARRFELGPCTKEE